jgi:flavin reductase (DIM6/NTAB) family NADH-FMN oxidoreductase RutF
MRTGECVLNLPSVEQVGAVDRLARTTGSDPVPPHKAAMGYRHERDKFGVSGLTAVASDLVAPPRVAECPVQLEAVLEKGHPLEGSNPDRAGRLIALEVRIVRAHLDESVMMEGAEDRVDPDRWRPLMMSFCRFYGLGEEAHPSRLAEIPESAYRYPRPAYAPRPRDPACAAPPTGPRARRPLPGPWGGPRPA